MLLLIISTIIYLDLLNIIFNFPMGFPLLGKSTGNLQYFFCGSWSKSGLDDDDETKGHDMKWTDMTWNETGHFMTFMTFLWPLLWLYIIIMIMLVIIITRSMIIMTIVNVMTLSLHILHGVRLLRFLSPRQDDMFFLNWDHTWVYDNGHLSVLCIVKRTISIIILVILTIILVSFYIDGHNNKENHRSSNRTTCK